MSTTSLNFKTLQLHSGKSCWCNTWAIAGCCCCNGHFDDIKAGFEQAFVKIRAYAPELI